MFQETNVKFRMEGGMKPGNVLVQAADDEQATMIVMGTRGMGTVRRTILGIDIRIYPFWFAVLFPFSFNLMSDKRFFDGQIPERKKLHLPHVFTFRLCE